MELQKITSNYGVQIKAALFKSNVNKIAFSLGELLKSGRPEVHRAIRLGVAPVLVKPSVPKAAVGKELDLEGVEIYKWELPEYFKVKKQWTANKK